jgi:hypothetical protein
MFFSFVAETPGGDVLPIALDRLLKNVHLPDGYIPSGRLMALLFKN